MQNKMTFLATRTAYIQGDIGKGEITLENFSTKMGIFIAHNEFLLFLMVVGALVDEL